MEGVGLYTAAHSEKVDWILVKAISDFADGNKASHNIRKLTAENDDKVTRKTSHKKRHQEIAAKNAAQFVIHVLLKTQLI